MPKGPRFRDGGSAAALQTQAVTAARRPGNGHVFAGHAFTYAATEGEETGTTPFVRFAAGSASGAADAFNRDPGPGRLVQDAAIAAPADMTVLEGERKRHFAVLVLEASGREEVPILLRGDGFRVHAARSADKALRTMEEQPDIGIILSDLYLEGERGVDIYERLVGKLPPERPLGAIFVAEAAAINDVVAAMRIQAVDFLRKPTPAPSLLAAVRRADRILCRRAAERIMMRRAGELLEATRAVIDWFPTQPAFPEADEERASAEAHDEVALRFDELASLGPGTEEMLTLTHSRREVRRVSAAMRQQRAQRRIFGAELVANPCWDMLLDLYQKTLLGASVSVSSLGLASGVPMTTALRRIAKLEELGLVVREPDRSDGRRVLVKLSPEGSKQLGAYFEETA